MAHYAFLDENNIVVEIITGVDEDILLDGLNPEEWYQNFRGMTCKRCSYNTQQNAHLKGESPFRGNFPQIGYTFDPNKGQDGAFIPPKIFQSWILDEETFSWKAPIEYPNDGNGYVWNEELVKWDIVHSEQKIV